MARERYNMSSGELVDTSGSSYQESFKRVKEVLRRLNNLTMYDEGYRAVVEELLPSIPKSSVITPPFYCDLDNIKIGEDVFINYDCAFLDIGGIEIGSHTLIGPAVQIYTPQHPHNHLERRKTIEWIERVVIGDDCWIGGGAIILPGVTIGDRVIIGAGSVVVDDIPSDSVAVGNPARVVRQDRPE